jgi:hypothetical protein
MIKPYNRRELYIAALSDNTVTLPDYPLTRWERYMCAVNGKSVQLPASPCNREELYLARMNGETVEVPYPASRLEYYYYAFCNYDCDLPEPVSREEMLWARAIKARGVRITIEPEDVTVVAGETASFYVKARGGTKPYTYQWYYSNDGGVSWAKVSAASGKTDTYTIKTAVRHNGYMYYCQVTDDDGDEAYTKEVTLTVTSA